VIESQTKKKIQKFLLKSPSKKGGLGIEGELMPK